MKLDTSVLNDVRFIGETLYRKDLDALLDGPTSERLLGTLRQVASACFQEGSAEAELHLHRLLYRINLCHLAQPWEHAAVNAQHPLVQRARVIIEDAWERRDRARYAERLRDIPSPEQLPEWLTERVRAHGSNVTHPLFNFLSESATQRQLRMFFQQETPFDIFFGDILLLMMPGIYGGMKEELCRNFWDEMGHGSVPRMHRSLRLQMMKQLDIPPDHHLNQVDEYCLEELRLANMYFDAAINRGKLLQAIGMMLATELMVPGRLDRQIEGWRRVGLKDEDMTYLLEHCVVDIEHSRGWMNNVVGPLITRQPGVIRDILLGVERRLENAGAVCDAMMALFKGQAPAK